MSLATALAQLDAVLATLDALETQERAELAPLLARPAKLALRQRKGMYDGAYDTAFRIKRTAGDLVACRGTLVVARLSLKVLLSEADSLPIVLDPQSFPREVVHCTGREVCAFFSVFLEQDGHADADRVTLRVYGEHTTKRTYDIPAHCFPHPRGLSGECAEHASQLFAGKARKRLLEARAEMADRPAKRARVEAYEAEWHEDAVFYKRQK